MREIHRIHIHLNWFTLSSLEWKTERDENENVEKPEDEEEND